MPDTTGCMRERTTVNNDGLDLTPLERAVSRLHEGLQRYQQDITDDQIRDGLIQRFEYTYEISHKMLKRFLEKTSANPADFDGMTFQDLIRTGNERGLLLGDWPAWRNYRDMRGRTSHTYAEAVALQVVAGIPGFLAEATHLLGSLRAAA
jgi:nucleotidyltransferase substrate binding protein (TIGR01987 family)